jgi:ABC-type uncharacterized transport system substrate-binding protein
MLGVNMKMISKMCLQRGISVVVGLLSRIFLLLAGLFFADAALATRCLYVSSYHQGYEWNDGIERGIERVLEGRCELRYFYMDTKRHPTSVWAEDKAREAVVLIADYRPDVVIVADDNASKYLVMPYYRDADIPFVFCGINWSIEEYGYPYRNTTGMVEVAPIRPLLKQIRRVLPAARLGLFLSASVTTEYKDYNYYKEVLAREGVSLFARLVSTMDEWERAYLQAQRYDFIILGNNAGISDWDKQRAAHFALKNAGKLAVSTYDWMMPYVAFALTKVPEEQGEWAAKVALGIIDGLAPGDVPIIPNRRWEAWVNPLIVQKLDIVLPESLRLKAREYR